MRRRAPSSSPRAPRTGSSPFFIEVITFLHRKHYLCAAVSISLLTLRAREAKSPSRAPQKCPRKPFITSRCPLGHLWGIAGERRASRHTAELTDMGIRPFRGAVPPSVGVPRSRGGGDPDGSMIVLIEVADDAAVHPHDEALHRSTSTRPQRHESAPRLVPSPAASRDPDGMDRRAAELRMAVSMTPLRQANAGKSNR